MTPDRNDEILFVGDMNGRIRVFNIDKLKSVSVNDKHISEFSTDDKSIVIKYVMCL